MPGTPGATVPGAATPPPPHAAGAGRGRARAAARRAPARRSRHARPGSRARDAPADAPPPDSAARIPYAFAQAHGVLAAGDEGDAVVVLTRPDATVDGLAELQARAAAAAASRARSTPSAFAAELARAYNHGRRGVAQLSRRPRARDRPRAADAGPAGEPRTCSTAATQAPVIRMINALLLQALRERASDLHFEPYEARSVVRFRVDGVLRDVIEPPRALHAALVSRLKIMASLDIAEKRLPQDGRIALKLGDKQVDVRVSTLPTGPGRARRAAPARQGRGAARPHGARHERRRRSRRSTALIREPHGIVLVTGPDRLGQDDDALRGAVAAAARHAST